MDCVDYLARTATLRLLEQHASVREGRMIHVTLEIPDDLDQQFEEDAQVITSKSKSPEQLKLLMRKVYRSRLMEIAAECKDITPQEAVDLARANARSKSADYQKVLRDWNRDKASQAQSERDIAQAEKKTQQATTQEMMDAASKDRDKDRKMFLDAIGGIRDDMKVLIERVVPAGAITDGTKKKDDEGKGK